MDVSISMELLRQREKKFELSKKAFWLLLCFCYLFMADFSSVDVDTSFFVGRDVILILNRSEM